MNACTGMRVPVPPRGHQRVCPQCLPTVKHTAFLRAPRITQRSETVLATSADDKGLTNHPPDMIGKSDLPAVDPPEDRVTARRRSKLKTTCPPLSLSAPTGSHQFAYGEKNE